ncbi:MAG: hypothetical protein OMM_02321 [Candidatus Magnetoglobus multicellularis str. Araruama]|uniref:ATPase domain protein, prokaryote domain protein n=1 Tax=Candidatus Magnetoglobus multicellularis str. Araruama TaxID=890399 RepID=A0A1V1PA59_9BACT|nr:MAG: hypothetical protein OMM_02321 [Candidatus Magnetoglobus multicellularis str. Araruama]
MIFFNVLLSRVNTMINYAIKQLVPDEIYTDRKDFLEYFYQAAYKAATRRTMSTVLLGQRRMGKTEIFKRVVNCLFCEQDHKSTHAVIPVYYKFPDNITDRWEFSVKYVENFIRWYAAFRLNHPEIIDEHSIKRLDLVNFVKNNMTVTQGFQAALNIFLWLQEKDVTIPEQSSLITPRVVSDRDDSTIVMFLDEIQNIHLPQQDFSIVGHMQDAVESLTCPHFVTGSAMSILYDILGKGSLYGRFDDLQIKPFTDFYGAELVKKAARYFHASIPEIMMPVISDRCGGNPFYINAVVQRSAKLNEPINNEAALNEILAIDLSSGFIYTELRDQVMKWIDRLNNRNITKWILYLAALDKENKIDPIRIQKELKAREGEYVEIEDIRNVMIKLSQGDLIDYKEFGGWFTHINDPVLQEFLKVWGEIEVAGKFRNKIEQEVIKEFQSLTKKYKNYQGYLAEVFMIQVLWNNQKKTLDGQFFHQSHTVKMPNRFIFIDHRSKLNAGKGMEIDIYATAGLDLWIAESKWWNKPVDVSVVRQFIDLGKRVKEREEMDGGLNTLTLWLFASNGVTRPAQEMLDNHGIYWSTKSDLNALLRMSGLRELPDIE